MKMNAELKQRWIDALRSGNFKQGQDRLCNYDGSYCCLGVLEQVADGEVEMLSFDRARSMPSADWLREHNITSAYDELENLARMNDGQAGQIGEYVAPKSFSEIADYIEATVEGVDGL